MSTRRSGHAGRKRTWPRRLPSAPAAPPTSREQWDHACADLVDAVMTDDREAARTALAVALVLLGRLELPTPIHQEHP